MTKTIRVRKMEHADVPAVARLEAELFTGPWSEENFENALQWDNQVMLVAEREDIAGYAVLCTAADQADLANIAVRSGERRRGIADALMQSLLKTAAEKGVHDIFLEVRESNEAAINLYHKYGFIQISVRKGYYDLPKEDALLMARCL